MVNEVCKDKFEQRAESFVVNAPAKINLFLMIGGKRPDGFHDIDTLMTKITWYDRLLFEHTNSGGIELICDGTFWAPQDESNLVLRAARQIVVLAGIKEPNLRITLTKNIPAGTGLGSASSDCAATIEGIDRFLDIGLSRKQMNDVASSLGSDIPFFLGPPVARCTGRGEIVTPYPLDLSGLAFQIYLPGIDCKTPAVYAAYSHNQQIYIEFKNKLERALQQQNVADICHLKVNMLSRACFSVYPEMLDFARMMEGKGEKIALSGSGSAFYSILNANKLENCKKNGKIESGVCCNTGMLVFSNSW